MHSVNLDLLHASARPADPHAHHRAEHLADLRTVCRQRWLERLARLRALFAHHPAAVGEPCPDRLS